MKFRKRQLELHGKGGEKMSEVADQVIDGFFCSECGQFIDGETPGHLRKCIDCTAIKGWAFKLVGVTFGNRQKHIFDHARYNSRYTLIREPQNPFDKNAILVKANGYDLGYVPRNLAETIAPLIDCGMLLKVKFVRKLIDDKMANPAGIMIRIHA